MCMYRMTAPATSINTHPLACKASLQPRLRTTMDWFVTARTTCMWRMPSRIALRKLRRQEIGRASCREREKMTGGGLIVKEKFSWRVKATAEITKLHRLEV